MIFKNDIKYLYTFILLALFIPGNIFAQATLEFTSGAGNPTGSGPTVTNQVITLQKNTDNPTGNTFTAFTPTTTATFSLTNQQQTMTPSPGVGAMFGGTSNGSGATVNTFSLFPLINAVGAASNTHFTSANSTATTGIDVATNNNVSVYLTTRPLAQSGAPLPTSTNPFVKYQYTDLVITFNQPVTNPVLHFAGCGANTSGAAGNAILFSPEFQLLTSGLTFTRLSGSTEFTVPTTTTIVNGASQYSAVTGSGGMSGSAQVNGQDITSITLRVYLDAQDNSSIAANATDWNIVTNIIAGDLFTIGVSVGACNAGFTAPVLSATSISNTCPATTVDLNSLITTTPSGSSLLWFTNNAHSGTAYATPTSAAAGIYYAFYYDAANNCYSPASNPLTVNVSNCPLPCYKPAITSGTALDTKLGITALGRAGTNNGNWPMVRKGAWIALEAKTKGFVVNRLTAAQIAAIPTANCVEGMMVYDTTNSCLKIYTTTDNGGTYSWQCFNTQTCPDAIPTGAVTGINCNGATNNGILVSGTAASGVNSVISYTGGNGAAYNGQVLASTGVTGLTATLAAGNFASGSGTLTYVITGTPNGSGTASFTINIGGQSCVLTRTVAASAINVRIAQYGTYTIGSADHPNFKLQLLNTSNYGPSGTYTGASGFTFTDITSTLGTQTAAQLKSNYDIINTGYLAMTVAQAQTIKDFVNLGGVAIVFLDSTSKDFSSIFNIFGHTGTSGDGQQLATASTTESLSSYFGNTLGVALAGSDTMGRVISSQLPAGSRIIATENTGGGIAVWTVGGYNGKVIFVWDEGLFRNPISGANIDTDQEKFVHNLMAYAIDKARGL